MQILSQRCALLFALVAAGSSTFNPVTAADLSPLVVNQWVQHDPARPLLGTVLVPQSRGSSRPVESASVALVGEDGQVRRARTNADGVFELSSVQPGIYALTARGKDVFSVVALHVVDTAASGAAAYPDRVEVPAATLDYSTIHAAVVRYLPPKEAPWASFSMRSVELAELAKQVIGKDTFRVARTDGGLVGQIFTAGAAGDALPAAAQTNVFITRAGEEVARTVTDVEGRFHVANLDLGQYSVLAVGQSGLGLVGFELVDANVPFSASVGIPADGETLVAQADCGCSGSFAMQVAPMPAVVDCVGCLGGPGMGPDGIFVEDALGVDGFGAPIPGGGYFPGGGGFGGGGGGFGGGGGGFGGGGGGLGGLLGLAAAGGIAAAAIAAADDDDEIDDFFGPLPAISTSGIVIP